MIKKLVLFGAGKIGRSFIGQLFATAGYEVVFVDINEQIINELNQKQQYKVVIKSNLPGEVILVENVRGVLGTERQAVVAELTTCDLAAVSVGQRGLEAIIPVLAEGIKARRDCEQPPLDIIIAENMRNSDEFIRLGLRKCLEADFPLDDMVGLVETSIGKMVPIIPDDVVAEDPLIVYAEPYNTLILDKKGFKNPIPDVAGLSPKENIKAWVDRKSFIHNFGHAAAAYGGYIYNSNQTYIFEVLSNLAVKTFVYRAMSQSAAILRQKYPDEFTENDLELHISDLISRFENKALKDTVFRVGCDLKRKLHKDDRIVAPLLEGLSFGLPVDYIMLVFAFGLCFKPYDGRGKLFLGDYDFFRQLQENGLEHIIREVVKLDVGKSMDTILLHSDQY